MSLSGSVEHRVHLPQWKLGHLLQRIGNIVGLLLTAVPEFFVEPAYEVNIYRATLASSLRTEVLLQPRRLAISRLESPFRKSALISRVCKAAEGGLP